MATTLRVADSTRARAAGLARESGTTIGEIVDRALDAYETARFWEDTRRALEANPGATESEWSAVDRDGLERG